MTEQATTLPPDDADDDADAPVTVSDDDRDPTEYERQLRRQARDYRLKLREADARATARETALKAEMEATVAEVRTGAEQRLIRAELRAHAARAGIVDPADLALMDLSTIKLDDKGDVVGAEGAIDAFKVAKPHLFKAASTSSTASAPATGSPGAKLAKDMTPEEYRAARAELTKPRR